MYTVSSVEPNEPDASLNMIFSKQSAAYGAIALTSLIFWGSYAKSNHARQPEVSSSQACITPTLSESNVFEAANPLLSARKCSEYNSGNDYLVEANSSNILTNTNLSQANITRANSTRTNLEKINLRDILILEIVVVTLIIAYTFLQQP